MRATGKGSRDFAGRRSRVHACLFEEKGVIPRYTRSRETIFSQEKWEKTVCFDRLATKLCFKVCCPIFVTFFKHAKHTGIKRCGFCAQQQGGWGVLLFDSLS